VIREAKGSLPAYARETCELRREILDCGH
jgi:hypothetical protein